MIMGDLAIAVAALFAGAAFYVSFAEQPARLKLDDRAALTEWGPSYKRGFIMQASLAVIGFVFGLLAWRQSGNVHWLTGACILIAAWPYTLLVMMRTNKRLFAAEPVNAGPESRALLKKWGQMHLVRTALGCAALVVFLLASVAS
jgi:uncharacterized membrane protein